VKGDLRLPDMWPVRATRDGLRLPEQLRNGPCGGVSPIGECEVHPGVRCVWLVAFERAEAEGRASDLTCCSARSITGSGGAVPG
jgi:methylene-tetrahydrofolate reductase-like protein